MEIIQKRFSNRATFSFGESQLKYTIKDSGGSQSFSIDYGSIPAEVGEREERNAWFRNVGIFWIAIGVLQIGARFTEQGRLKGSIWFTLGILCFIVYWAAKTRYSVINTDKGLIFIIKNKQHDQVMNELDARRKRQWRQLYGEVDLTNDLAREIEKFRWLKENNVISEAEYNEAVIKIAQHHDARNEDDTDESIEPLVN